MKLNHTQTKISKNDINISMFNEDLFAEYCLNTNDSLFIKMYLGDYVLENVRVFTPCFDELEAQSLADVLAALRIKYFQIECNIKLCGFEKSAYVEEFVFNNEIFKFRFAKYISKIVTWPSAAFLVLKCMNGIPLGEMQMAVLSIIVEHYSLYFIILKKPREYLLTQYPNFYVFVRYDLFPKYLTDAYLKFIVDEQKWLTFYRLAFQDAERYKEYVKPTHFEMEIVDAESCECFLFLYHSYDVFLLRAHDMLEVLNKTEYKDERLLHASIFLTELIRNLDF